MSWKSLGIFVKTKVISKLQFLAQKILLSAFIKKVLSILSIYWFVQAEKLTQQNLPQSRLRLMKRPSPTLYLA